MDSRPREVRLSESSPPAGRRDSAGKEPEALIVGSIKEKGFSVSSYSPGKISGPQPRVTPFPVARHRSEGPYWAPASRTFGLAATTGGEQEDESGALLAGLAEPLQRKKDGRGPVSQWRSSRKNVPDEPQLQDNVPRTTSTMEPSVLDPKSHQSVQSLASRSLDSQRSNRTEEGTSSDTTKTSGSHDEGSSCRLGTDDAIGVENSGPPKNLLPRPLVQLWQTHRTQQSEMPTPNQSEPLEVDDATEAKKMLQDQSESAKEVRQLLLVQNRGTGAMENGLAEETDSATKFGHLGMEGKLTKEIDAENRRTLLAMTSAQVEEAQIELSDKLRPELLEKLRRRGALKERRRLLEKSRTGAMNSSETDDYGVKIEPVERASSSYPRSQSDMPSETRAAAADLRNVVRTGGDEGISGSDSVDTSHPRIQTVRSQNRMTEQSTATAEPVHGAGQFNSQAEETPSPSDGWTLRVEAVRLMRFDLGGCVVSYGHGKEEDGTLQPSSEGLYTAKSQQSTLSVVERDMLRTEGDPARSGYSLKEALALVRSTVPGQRAVALRLIASVLERAISGLQGKTFDSSSLNYFASKGSVDWQAVWAYALGPEAEIVLTLRIALDDGHSTVVAACARAIQALLSYFANESFFDSLEALWPGDKVLYTAPIFRRKTKQDEGFIGNGRWKYNVKTSEMFPFSGTSVQEKVEEEGKDTVGEDGHVSNKDVAAGLIRMGVLPRLRYILEVDKLSGAEEEILCILISLARHSPTAANAVMKCPRLINTVLDRFIVHDGNPSEESLSSRLKAVRLLKVLSQASRSNCVEFEKSGILVAVLGHILQHSYSDSHPGIMQKLSTGFCSTMVEALRFWRVCLKYRIGISLFTDCYSTLCFWLLPMSKEEILSESTDASVSLALESYKLLEDIGRTLPVLHDNLSPFAQAGHLRGWNWTWSVAMAMLNTALKWLSPDCISAVHDRVEQYLHDCEEQDLGETNLKSRTRKVLGILASVLHFLGTLCEKIVSDNFRTGYDGASDLTLPFLPTFIPHLGLALARSGLLNYPIDEDGPDVLRPISKKTHTLVECLGLLLSTGDNDSKLVSINCLNALIRVTSVVDMLINVSKPKGVPAREEQSIAHTILDHGLLFCAGNELRSLLVVTEKELNSRIKLINMSGRGGPAPGVGVGWGSFCGGVWSRESIVAQASANLILELVSILIATESHPRQPPSGTGPPGFEVSDGASAGEAGPLFLNHAWRMNTSLAIVAVSTPAQRDLVSRVCSSMIFHPTTILALIAKLEEALSNWRKRKAQGDDSRFENIVPEYEMLDASHVSKILVEHLETFWLTAKRKTLKHGAKAENNGFDSRPRRDLGSNLATVQEEITEDNVTFTESLMLEWAGQRSPLPSHWFLSPLVTDVAQTIMKEGRNQGDTVRIQELEEVIKAGLTFSLGFELLKDGATEAESAGTLAVPLVRKIHSVSTVFISGGDVFLQPLARDLIGALQDSLGHQLEREKSLLLENSGQSSGEAQRGLVIETGVMQDLSTIESQRVVPLSVTSTGSVVLQRSRLMDFESAIDPSYMTYTEMLAEQFGAISYGDVVFARQVALHLWMDVPEIIRLATWRVLADGRVLELIPPLSNCCGPPQSYLYPTESNSKIVEAYVTAWACGALDRAAVRDSLTFTLVLHHVGGFIFNKDIVEDPLLKKKLIRTVVRSTLGKSNRQTMLSGLLQYIPAFPPLSPGGVQTSREVCETTVPEQVKTRLAFLFEACEGDAMLLSELQHVQNLFVS